MQLSEVPGLWATVLLAKAQPRWALYEAPMLPQNPWSQSQEGTCVNPVVARNEIEPLLSALIRELAAQGRTTERAIYSGIRERLCSAKDPCELTRPFHDLSAMAYMRRPASNDADCLLARILEKTERLSLAANPSPEIH